MEFPSLDLVQALQGSLNDSEAFNAASRWSDVTVLLYFARQRYWLKLYGDKVIDMMEYFSMANPLGWGYLISAPLDIWRCLALAAAHRDICSTLAISRWMAISCKPTGCMNRPM